MCESVVVCSAQCTVCTPQHQLPLVAGRRMLQPRCRLKYKSRSQCNKIDALASCNAMQRGATQGCSTAQCCYKVYSTPIKHPSTSYKREFAWPSAEVTMWDTYATASG